jgi:hypothetical protein
MWHTSGVLFELDPLAPLIHASYLSHRFHTGRTLPEAAVHGRTFSSSFHKCVMNSKIWVFPTTGIKDTTTARKLYSDGTIRVNIGCSHPRETRMEANRVIPSTDVKSVKGIRVELGLSIDRGKCIPRLHPTNLWLGASHRCVIHWVKNHRFNIESVIFQPMERSIGPCSQAGTCVTQKAAC